MNNENPELEEVKKELEIAKANAEHYAIETAEYSTQSTHHRTEENDWKAIATQFALYARVCHHVTNCVCAQCDALTRYNNKINKKSK